jgi:hypothetical protein
MERLGHCRWVSDLLAAYLKSGGVRLLRSLAMLEVYVDYLPMANPVVHLISRGSAAGWLLRPSVGSPL